MHFRAFWVFLGATLFGIQAGYALTAEVITDAPREALYRSAKRMILTEGAMNAPRNQKIIQFEDPLSGLIRFTFYSESYTEKEAEVEVIQLDDARSKLRVTFPTDRLGRAQIFVERIGDAVRSESEGTVGRELPYLPSPAFQSAERYVLKRYLRRDQKKDDVIQLEDAEAGILKFVYRDGEVSDPKAIVQIIPWGKGGSRLIVSLGTLGAARRILLEDELVRAIGEDLAADSQDTSEPTP